MTLYGYWRCSTDLQDQERQVIALKEEGVPEENIYGDKSQGQAITEREKNYQNALLYFNKMIF